MAEKSEKSWFSRLQERLAADVAADDTSPEEIEKNKAERKAQEGTMWEWAQMQANGDIAIRITQYGIGGSHGTGDYVVALNDESYDKCRTEYGLDQPGDTRHITKRWINDAWVLEKTERTNSNLAPPQLPKEGKHSQAS